MIAMKILKTVLDTWGYRELFMWNKKITSYDEIQKFDVKKQRWASRTDTRTFKNEFAVSELVENELGPLGKWNYSETIFILNTVISWRNFCREKINQTLNQQALYIKMNNYWAQTVQGLLWTEISCRISFREEYL